MRLPVVAGATFTVLNPMIIILEHDAVAVDVPDGGVRKRDEDATDGEMRTHHSDVER